MTASHEHTSAHSHEHGCTHEHGHEHEHEHEHGHRHEHGHGHEHGHHCTHGHAHNGHAHNHEHAHEHNHEHNHGHEHNHSHEHPDSDSQGISINEHEGALIAALSLEIPDSYANAEQLLANKLETLAKAVVKAGGIIGHIKATLAGDATVGTLSTTGRAVNITRGSANTSKADVVAIVLALSEENLRLAMAQALL